MGTSTHPRSWFSRLCLLSITVFCVSISNYTSAADKFITIGGGDTSGVYFPAGLSIASLLNKGRGIHSIRASVEATAGSTFNINAILAGYMEFGFTQSDKQYDAVNGLTEWAKKGPQAKLRSVFSLHHEALTLVAAADVGIETVLDLKGKRVSSGNPGSSQHRIVKDVLLAFGLEPETDISLTQVMGSDAAMMLQDGHIDAYFFTVGHPSNVIRQGLSGSRKSYIVPITGSNIDNLVLPNDRYTQTIIPVEQLYPEVGMQKNVATIGVVATLCTTSDVEDEIVYSLTKAVFENLDYLKKWHPALANLTQSNMVLALAAPLHSGARRYYKEVGISFPAEE